MLTDFDTRVIKVVDHLNSLREVVAAGLRSGQQLDLCMQKMPKDQQEMCCRTAERIKTLLLAAPGQAGINLNASASSPEKSPRASSSSSTATAHLQMSPSASTTLTPDSEGHNNNLLLFRHAILGTCDAPQDPERIPRPGCPGLVQGDVRPLKAFFLSRRALVEGLYHILEEEAETQEALSFLNMLWVQSHPLDFEAQAIDVARIAVLKSRVTATSLRNSTSGSVGSDSPGTRLEDSMKHLLFLNLGLKYRPADWAELLQLRDTQLNVLHQARALLDSEIRSHNVATSCFPSLVKVSGVLEGVIAATTFLRIYSSPEDIRSLLFERYSNAMVELNFVLHDHDDLTKQKKKLRATVEKICSECVEQLKCSIRALHAAVGANDDDGRAQEGNGSH